MKHYYLGMYLLSNQIINIIMLNIPFIYVNKPYILDDKRITQLINFEF